MDSLTEPEKLMELTEKYTVAMLSNPSVVHDTFIYKTYPEALVDCANLMAKKTLEYKKGEE